MLVIWSLSLGGMMAAVVEVVDLNTVHAAVGAPKRYWHTIRSDE